MCGVQCILLTKWKQLTISSIIVVYFHVAFGVDCISLDIIGCHHMGDVKHGKVYIYTYIYIVFVDYSIP